MRFLLKQRLEFKKKKTIFYLYPNEFSRYIVRKANEADLIFDTKYIWENGYRNVEHYEILENDFKFLFKKFKTRILRKREKFSARPPLEKLILILRYCFKRNNNAKSCDRWSATQKAYDDKSRFLRIALDIAKNIKLSGFSYGWQEDPSEPHFCYIYYFQFKDKQVSFHSPKLYQDVPQFKGRWIGYRNDSFPFDLRKMKKYV